jgi:hypothetical protein
MDGDKIPPVVEMNIEELLRLDAGFFETIPLPILSHIQPPVPPIHTRNITEDISRFEEMIDKLPSPTIFDLPPVPAASSSSDPKPHSFEELLEMFTQDDVPSPIDTISHAINTTSHPTTPTYQTSYPTTPEYQQF